MEEILKLKGITKKYGNKKVVNNVNLSIKKGHIYGLIGPNGAGKTTIMKMIAGQCLPNEGEIELFGNSENLNDGRKRSSFMIEAPYIDKSMTARQNMEYARYLRGVADEKKIDEILEFVGLGNVGAKKAGKFSLGMRQRLGIAIALLGSPEFLILDEPINGLDPEGIVEVRKKLLSLCENEGITILISSHILSELSELCTDFAIIDKGTLVECLSKEELDRNCKNYIAIKTTDNANLTTVLEQKLGVTNYKVIDDDEIRVYEMLDNIEKLSKTITDSGLVITKFNPEGENLEQYYLSRVSSSGDEEAEEPRKLFGLIKKGGK